MIGIFRRVFRGPDLVSLHLELPPSPPRARGFDPAAGGWYQPKQTGRPVRFALSVDASPPELEKDAFRAAPSPRR
jgi:hypothetical protein